MYYSSAYFKARLKMLIASAKKSLVEDLGESFIKKEMYAEKPTDLSWSTLNGAGPNAKSQVSLINFPISHD